jgi:4-amino-4-deoxy-L-arabinose transferase-like glycosyltransferase
MDRRSITFPLLLLTASLLFFCRLRTPLLEPEEARYAEIPRQMLHADRWIVPILNGQDYLDKPPLFYWLVMTSYRAFGVHDWSARLVAGLIGVLTVGVVYGWARRALGVRAAFAAGLVLCLTPEFVYRGRMVGPNGLLALFTTAALAAGHVALGVCRRNPTPNPSQKPRGEQNPLPLPASGRGSGGRISACWWLIAGAMTGLGLLTKGPVAFALVVPPLFVAPLFDRRLAHSGVVVWAVFFAASLAVAGPWYIAVAWRCPEFADYFLWFHNIVRFAAPFDHVKPIWFYLPQLALGLLPWPLLLVQRIRERLPAAAGFALLASAWGVLFFSLAGSKRPTYLLPVLPPFAIALGCYLQNLSARRWSAIGGVMFAAMWIGTNALLPSYAEKFSLKGLVSAPPISDPGLNIVCYPQPWEAVSFYLRRDDVRIVRADELERLVAELERRPEAALFVKTTALPDVVAALPPQLEFEATADRIGVTVGRVRAIIGPEQGASRADVRRDACWMADGSRR